MPDFADKLQAAMSKAVTSQSALARTSGVPQATISTYLLRVAKPSWENVQRLALALGLTCADLQDDGVALPEPDGAVIRKPGRPRKEESPPAAEKPKGKPRGKK